MKIIKQEVEEFKDKKLTKANKHLLGITNSAKKDYLLFDRFDDADEYEKGGDELASTPVNTSDPNIDDNIVGFITARHHIKYDKKNNEMVWYEPDEEMHSGNRLISYFKPENGIDYYKKLLQNYYLSELD